MKILFTVCLLFFVICSLAQLNGQYNDHFGNKLTFYANSTFKHEWIFDMSGGWTKGTWRSSNDTVYLTIVSVLDTLTRRDHKDRLVLSMDTVSSRIDEMQFAATQISGGGQQRRKPPTKLYQRNGKLYLIKPNGKIETESKSFLYKDKKYPTYYMKQTAHNNVYDGMPGVRC